ncbi:hypothetical protein FJZ31_32135 [Candidatus Poribacteria bacterium]|nr:hypothetical protein [Candidatus Poribacteria bacterium]
MIDKNMFKSPPMQYRPLQIVHDMGLHADLGLEECQRRIQTRLQRLKRLGFGGVVANVSHQDYLTNEANFQLFGKVLNEAQQEGFSVWMYDEKGYPSGSAGGLTLKGHPEYEAVGLVGIFEEAPNGGHLEIHLPTGHRQAVYARAYPLMQANDSSAKVMIAHSIDLSQKLDDAGTLRWTAPPGNWLVGYFATKPLYEETHAVHNYCAARRYLNLIDRAGVARFIDVTYKQYAQYFPEHTGKTLCASFTDEPSFIPTYMPKIPVQVAIEDEFDEDFPRYPTHTWSEELFDEFQQRRGYDLKPMLVYLFRDQSERAKQVRCDFHQTLSELYAEAFFGPIADFCKESGMAFSGHLLWEESLLHHAMLEGNFFSHLKQMDIPGIDILTTNPSAIVGGRGFLTAKLISSIAHLHGKRHTMSETSGFGERMGGREITLKMMTGTANVLYALGIDIITSYYGDTELEPAEYRAYSDYVARLGAVLDGGEHIAPVAIYYPIESLWAEYLPSEKVVHEIPHSDIARHIDSTFAASCRALMSNQLDFDIIDAEGLNSAKITNDGKSGLIVTSYEQFPVLVVPPMEIIDLSLLRKLEEFANNNVFWVVYQPYAKIGRNAEGTPQVQEIFARLLQRDNVVSVTSTTEMIEKIREHIEPDFSLAEPNPNILYLHRQFSNGDVYFIVNAAPDATNISASLATSGKVELWDAMSGEIKPLPAESEGKTAKVNLSLKGYEGVFIIVCQAGYK